LRGRRPGARRAWPGADPRATGRPGADPRASRAGRGPTRAPVGGQGPTRAPQGGQGPTRAPVVPGGGRPARQWAAQTDQTSGLTGSVVVFVRVTTTSDQPWSRRASTATF